jgi:hypothetical protein
VTLPEGSGVTSVTNAVGGAISVIVKVAEGITAVVTGGIKVTLGIMLGAGVDVIRTVDVLHPTSSSAKIKPIRNQDLPGIL